MFPHGLRNSASLVAQRAQLLFVDSTPTDQVLGHRTPDASRAHHFVNMVFVHTLPKDGTSSIGSSTGSIPTEVLHLEDDDYDMDFPPYPLGFHRFLVFPPQ